MIVLTMALLGLCAGSFINALVWRLKHKEDWLRGRSKCVHCNHQLAADDLIPVISWLILKGKCRYCRKPISWQYPIVEACTAVLFVCSYIFWPLGIEGIGLLRFGVWLLVLTGLLALFVYDIKWMVLPNKLIFPLIALVGLELLVRVLLFPKEAIPLISGAIYGLLCIGGLFYIIFQISDGRWIGGGDVKLGFLLGLIAGSPIKGLLVLFLSSFLGSLITLPLLLTGKLRRNSHVPFGPFLILATIVVQLFGTTIIDWYTLQL